MGIGQKNMDLTKINLFTAEKSFKVTEHDGESHIEESEFKVALDFLNCKLELKREDGTGIKFGIDPKIFHAAWAQINENIERSRALEQAREQREIEEHEQRMRELNARAAEAEFRLEEENLQHEIRMTELRIELAEKKKLLQETEEEK